MRWRGAWLSEDVVSTAALSLVGDDGVRLPLMPVYMCCEQEASTGRSPDVGSGQDLQVASRPSRLSRRDSHVQMRLCLL